MEITVPATSSEQGPPLTRDSKVRVKKHPEGGRFVKIWLGQDCVTINPFIPDQVKSLGFQLLKAAGGGMDDSPEPTLYKVENLKQGHNRYNYYFWAYNLDEAKRYAAKFEKNQNSTMHEGFKVLLDVDNMKEIRPSTPSSEPDLRME